MSGGGDPGRPPAATAPSRRDGAARGASVTVEACAACERLSGEKRGPGWRTGPPSSGRVCRPGWGLCWRRQSGLNPLHPPSAQSESSTRKRDVRWDSTLVLTWIQEDGQGKPAGLGDEAGRAGASRAPGVLGSGCDESRRPGFRRQKCVSSSSGGRKLETRVRGSLSWLTDGLLTVPSHDGERGSPVSPVWVLVPSRGPVALGLPNLTTSPEPSLNVIPLRLGCTWAF